MENKLAIIVPYRRRKEHLEIFLDKVPKYLEEKKINYEIIIVNQDDAKQFNRGMLLNIGYKYAKKMRCNYLVFHDVDMIPINVDYSYSNIPIHLATDFLLDNEDTYSSRFIIDSP
jgi:predicted metal-dependent hydrolase